MKEAIRKFIIQKASSIFADNGYKGTTIEDIAEAAGVSKPTLYNYFSSKEQLFLGVLDFINDNINDLLDPIVHSSKLFPEKIEEALSTLINYLNDHRGILHIVFHEPRSFAEVLKDGPDDHFRSFFGQKDEKKKKMDEIIRAGYQEGFIRETIPAKLVFFTIMGFFHACLLNLVLQKKEALSENEIRDVVSNMMEILATGIMNPSKQE